MVSPRADRGITSPVTVRPLWPLDGCGLCCTELKRDRNPQLLPCLHSVCQGCVPLSDFKTECPVCGRQYTSSEIIDNPFLPSFPTDSKPWCGGCDEPVVCGWCVECGEPLCSDCVAAHKRVKLTRNHNVLPQLPPGFSRTVLCPFHKREQMKLFCVTCDQLTCRDCQLTFHKEHKYQFAQDALPEQRKCLQYLIETVRMQRGTVQQNLQDLDGRLSDLEDLQESVRTEVKDILKGIWSVLVKRAMQLSKEMQDHCWEESECVTERQAHLRKLGERQKYVLAFTEKALKSEDHTSLLSCKRWVDKKSNLRSKIHSELQGVLDKNPSAVSTMKELKLHCGQDIHQTLGCFGEIVTKEVPFARLNLRKTQINPTKFSLEQQRNGRASSTLSPSSQETSSMSVGNAPLSQCQPTLMSSLSCPRSSPYPHEPERLSFDHFSPDSHGPSLQALSSSRSDSPLSSSSTSAVNATGPQRCAVNTENKDCSSLSGIALDTPVPYHGYQGGSSKSDLMVELVSPAFHVKRKAGDENVGPQIKRSCLQPLKVPADSSCERVPPIGTEKQAGDVAATVVIEREATPNITDQNATAPMYGQEANKTSGSRQSNLVVGRSVKTANQVVLAPFTLPVTGNSVTWGMSPANATLFPGTVNTPPSFGCVRAVPPYLVLSNSAPISVPTGAVGRLDNGSLVFICNDVPFFNILSHVRGGQNQVRAGSVPGGLRPPCLPDPTSPKSPMEAPQSQSTGPIYPIRIFQQVKNISTVQDTKQPTQNGTAQSGLCRKDEAASTLLVHTANAQADSVQMDISKSDVDLIQADPNPTVFVMEKSTEIDIVHNKTAQPDFVQNETSQAELVQTASDRTVLFQNKTAQMVIVPAQVVGIKEEQTLRPVTGPMESVTTDMLNPAKTVPVQINLVHSNTVQNDIVHTETDQTYFVNVNTKVSGITIKEEPPATDSLSVTGLMEPIRVIMPDTLPTETVQTDPVHTQMGNVTEIVQRDVFQPETVEMDSAFIEMVQTDSAFIETVQTDSAFIETVQTDSAFIETVQTDSAFIETVQTDSAFIETVQTDSAFIETGQTDSAFIETGQTDSAFIETGQTDSAFIETGQTDSAFIETGQTDSAFIETGQTDSAFIETGQTDSAFIETGQTDSAFIETGQTDSAFIETGQTDSARAETLQNEIVQSNFNEAETVQTDPVLTEPVYAVQIDTLQMEPVHSETGLTGIVQTATLQRDLALTDCTEIIQTDMSTTNEVSTNDTVNVVSVPSCTQEVELDIGNDFCSPIVEEDDNMADVDVSAADSIEETGCQASVRLNSRFPQVSLLWMPILDAHVSVPPTRFRLLPGVKGQQTIVQVIQTDAPQPESPCSSMSSPDSLRSTHQLRPLLARRKHCTACRMSGNLTLCVVCGRRFHRECHVPPIYSLSTESWQCMLCRDLSDLALLQDYSGTDGGLCMSPPDQMRCERLLLVLLCRKCSIVLYRPAKLSSRSSHYIDITTIRGRLLRKLVPHYCTPSEFVSDVWLLLHTLLKSVKSVDRLQACFGKELGKMFEGTLHPSLLVNPHQGEAEEAEQEGDKEKVTMRKNPRPLEVERAGKDILRRTK